MACRELQYYFSNEANSDYHRGSAAHFEYSPFGKTTVASGSIPNRFAFRFSSEYHDSETNLVYYNYRYYSPELGGWLNRDPIGERGGENLYGFVGNDGINKVDFNGLWIIEILEWLGFYDGCCNGVKYDKRKQYCCNGKLFEKTEKKEIFIYAVPIVRFAIIQHAWIEWNGTSAGFGPIEEATEKEAIFTNVPGKITSPEPSLYTDSPYKILLRKEVLKADKYDLDIIFDNLTKEVKKAKDKPPIYSAIRSAHCEAWAQNTVTRAMELSRCKSEN